MGTSRHCHFFEHCLYLLTREIERQILSVEMQSYRHQIKETSSPDDEIFTKVWTPDPGPSWFIAATTISSVTPKAAGVYRYCVSSHATDTGIYSNIVVEYRNSL